MTVKECYGKMGGDYDGVQLRLIKDERIEKYLRKFVESTDFEDLLAALKNEDYETAFRAAHSIKGVSLNLGFIGLQDTSSELCEVLRGGKPNFDIGGMVEALKTDYELVVSTIKSL